MQKSLYFSLQAVWSVILSSVVWYYMLINVDFDFYGNSDNSFAGMILFFGASAYLVLTIVYICIGVKKVKEWHWWVILVSLAVAGVSVFAGLYLVVYGTEYFNRVFHQVPGA